MNCSLQLEFLMSLYCYVKKKICPVTAILFSAERWRKGSIPSEAGPEFSVQLCWIDQGQIDK
jgi:hypothetical protein